MDEMVPPKRCSHGGSQGSPGGAGKGESQDPNSGTFRIGTWPGPRIWNTKAYVLMHLAGPCTPVLISADCRVGSGEEGREFRPLAAGRARAGPVSTRGLGGGVAPTPGPGAKPHPRVPAAGPGGRSPPLDRPRWSLVNARPALPMHAEPLPCRTPSPTSRLNRKARPGRHSAQPRPPGPEGPRKGLGRRARARL